MITLNQESHVILLHGLGRNSRMMDSMTAYFLHQQIPATNIDYPSTRYSIEQLVELYLIPVLQSELIRQANSVHFVCHSMGSILVRYYLRHYSALPNLGRIVMCAPPNHGSELASFLSHFAFYRRWFGPAGVQLGTSAECVPNQLGGAIGEVGIITGTKCLNPLWRFVMPSPSDGKVSVESAKLDGMRDFLVGKYGHAEIVSHPDVIAQTVYFLREGKFDRANDPA